MSSIFILLSSKILTIFGPAKIMFLAISIPNPPILYISTLNFDNLFIALNPNATICLEYNCLSIINFYEKKLNFKHLIKIKIS